jgi:hypothetical protein
MMSDMTRKSGEEREKAREDMKKIFLGLKKRFRDPDDYLSDDILEAITEINNKVLPTINFQRKWDDHFRLIDAVIGANNEESLFFKVGYERLGNMGIVVHTELPQDVCDGDCPRIGPYHPFALLLAANVKYLFRDLSVTIKSTRYSGRNSTTEILMQ